MQRDNELPGTLAAFRGLTDCVVAALDGAELLAEMDVEALRRNLGPIYGIKVGAAVRYIAAENVQPVRIVWLEQVD